MNEIFPDLKQLSEPQRRCQQTEGRGPHWAATKTVGYTSRVMQDWMGWGVCVTHSVVNDSEGGGGASCGHVDGLLDHPYVVRGG